MLDLIGAIFGTAYYATVVGVVIALSRVRPATALAALAAAGAWLALIVAAAALGWTAPGAVGPIPATLLPFVGLLALGLGSWAFFAPFRQALLSLPLAMLIALHAWRVGGVLFLLLYRDGQLSAPFAPVAGMGDMITGALALVLAGMLALGVPVRRTWLVLWNAFGALDLVVAVSLGLLSAAGTPFQVFTDAPGTLAMTKLPWLFVPSMIVPMLLMVHLTIAAKLGSAKATAAVAMAG
ncbi:MAG TPA: hypothetical protein VF502_01670 [Stellaceae bacterium]